MDYLEKKPLRAEKRSNAANPQRRWQPGVQGISSGEGRWWSQGSNPGKEVSSQSRRANFRLNSSFEIRTRAGFVLITAMLSDCLRSFRYKVVLIQVDLIEIEVVSRHHRSRFDTCGKSIRFNSIFRPVAGGEAGGSTNPEIFRFELNSATIVEFC